MQSSMRMLLVVLVALAYGTTVSGSGCNQWCGPKSLDCDDGLSCSDGICVASWCASAKGDPELRGLDGRKFYFTGEAGKVFNFISEQNHQVNAFFVEGPHLMPSHGTDGEKNGTFIGAMGLKLYNTSVKILVDDEGEMEVLVDNKRVNLTAANQYEQKLDFSKVTFTAHKYRDGMGESVHLVTDLYNLLVYATPKKWEESSQQIERGHLNLAMAVEPQLYFQSEVHGVLGQIKPDTAADNALLPPELQTDFLGEGSEMDYKVSGLFADDFKFNRFNLTDPITPTTVKAAKNLQVVASRRRLHEGSFSAPREWVDIIDTIAYHHA